MAPKVEATKPLVGPEATTPTVTTTNQKSLICGVGLLSIIPCYYRRYLLIEIVLFHLLSVTY